MGGRTEESLVDAAKRGDLDAFTELVRRTQERIHAVIYGMTRDRQDADDLTQETFLSAYRALPGFGGRSSFSTWAHRIAVNLTLNHLKKKGREKGRAELDENAALPEDRAAGPAAPESETERARLQEKIERAIADLPPGYRAAFTLVELQGMSHAEAAEVLGCAENTVSWRIHKARKALRERLKDEL